MGKTDDLKERHNSYLAKPNINPSTQKKNDSAKMQQFMGVALEHGCHVMRRYRYVEASDDNTSGGIGDRYAQMMETRMLSYFDYAYNHVSNPARRAIYLTPRTLFCCLPAGVTVHNTAPLHLGASKRQFPEEQKAGQSCLVWL